MSAVELFRLRFQALVARGLASSGIAARAGIAAASEVWGGAEPRDLPAWYLWLRGVPGAWQLELAGAGALPGTRSALIARFTVRHYPSPASPLLARFSPEERSAVRDALDATGTPRIDAPPLPEALFTIATVDWALEPEGDAAAFALSSLDRLRARSAAGEVRRDVPGWDLAAPVFSAVAALYAQVERRAATRLVLARQAGFELVAAPDGGTRDALDTVQGEAVLLFAGASGEERAAALVDALRDPAAAGVADVAFPPGRHPPHALDVDPRLALEIGHAWFGGAAHAEDRIACAC